MICFGNRIVIHAPTTGDQYVKDKDGWWFEPCWGNRYRIPDPITYSYFSVYEQSYEQQVTAINAKTEVIQQEDKTLELQLKQLDTEQQALSTEMDAVKKVIDKNVESTFKTFSS